MKKLLKFMACALAVSFGLTACDNGEESHHPYDSGYKPKGSQLNTSHAWVGKMYGVDGIVEDPAEAQGIVFAVSKDGSTAYLVAFTDAMVVGADVSTDAESYCYSNLEKTYFAPQQRWGLTVASQRDTTYESKEENGQTVIDTVVTRRAVINDVDGEVNTDRIIKLFESAKKQDTTITIYSSYAASICKGYYRRQWGKSKEDESDPIARKWQSTKGQWYLPSIEELGDLMKNRDKINKLYAEGKQEDIVGDNPYHFMAIGGEIGHAYWSSSEFDVSSAWYCLSRVGDGTDYSKNKRYGYLLKTENRYMFVRPIRKAPIKQQ
ncbi:MAG: hypothetical protein NC048_07355 [Bacteroides sp.]|nr:hypothetical protein [Ruminococcus flavefaciens]MCM1555297.1 hypothetical protein [Bacteroides sp.]